MATFLFAFAVLIAPTPAKAQGQAPVIAVVDVGWVIRESEAAKSLRAQLTEVERRYETEVGQLEEQLAQAEQDLSRQRSILAPDAFAEKRREVAQQWQEARRDVQQKQGTLQQAYGQALQRIDNTVRTIITGIAQQRGVTLVLQKGALAIPAPANFEISEEVLRQLNAQLPSVQVQLPQN